MATTAVHDADIRLHRAQLQPDGSHSSTPLRAAVQRGRMLRVRRGVYADASAWITAMPSRRHLISAAAEACGLGHAVFCRETALLLHGLPVLHTPETVTIRTRGPGRAALKAPTSMTGGWSSLHFLQRFQRQSAEPESLSTRAVEPLRTRCLEPALPPGVSRIALRERIARGTYANPEVLLPADAVPGILGPEEGYRVEPLGLAVVDTASRLTFPEAVVVLDAVKARHDVDLKPWMPYLRTTKQQRNWERAWAFSDGRAESPLESESRVVLDDLGFPPPVLQKEVRTRLGTFRVDMAWERERVAGEIDGRAKYLDPQRLRGVDPGEVHYQEKRRREALEEEGWKVARWGHEQLRAPTQLVRRLAHCGLAPD